MADSATVEAARRALGPVGVMLPNVPFAPQPTVAEQRAAVTRWEQAGHTTVWTNEGVGGKDAFTQLAILLAATERMTFAAGVLNMWARPPETAHGAATYLAQAFPGRFVAGFGIGYPFQAETVGREYRRPAASARHYLERLREVPPITPALDAPYAAILAANGARMLDVAREAADGAIPTVQPPAFTAEARAVLGPEKILVVGLPVVLDEDRDAARAEARRFLTGVLAGGDSPYAANLVRLGLPERAVREVADEVVEAVVAFGTPEDVAREVRAHHAAGADHVRLSVTAADFATGVAQLEQLAGATRT
ncbi:LLM class flavin-dependent oxidoreductase [Pseudonocardia sp. NPDC049154]|uniref:LLM class flavin-dependent oxidoreductase n=1 Tax=Pseudonocardia sp. NPDC049154 TaxID=3155501 RepID=UPI0033E3709E